MHDDVQRDLLEKNKYLNEEVLRLRHIILLFQKDKFGSKSEKMSELPPDQLLFNEIEREAKINATEPEQTELISGYIRKSKGRGVRKPFPAHLPREEIVIDLSEAEKICPKDGTELKQIGEDVCEKLKVVPARVSVVVERKKKYACPCCESHVAQARSCSLLPGTTSTVELISFLIFSKFFQGLPLYRLEELFKLQGIELKRGTMASWLIQAAERLQPIWNILEEWAFATKYLGIDATSLQVLKEDGRRPDEKSSMWARGSPELGIVLFDYDISNAGYVAERLILGFSGCLQADAHPGYHRLDKSVWRLGCMMHSRRKFYEAYVGAKKQPGLAHDGMQMIKKIYKLEEAYRDQNLTSDERYAARLLELKPQMEKMLGWCEAKKPKILPSSPIGIAINYYINEYSELVGFLADGRYEIDNGWIERAIRKYAIGRNNWLFCDSVDGAKASSLYYSLVVTAKLNGKNPFEVITEILKGLPFAKTIDDFEKLAALLVNKTVLN